MAGVVDPREVFRELFRKEEAALRDAMNVTADSSRLKRFRFSVARMRLRRRLRRGLQGSAS